MDCYLFDIDGTLADNSHRTHHVWNKPKHWGKFNATMAGDALHPHVAMLCRHLSHFLPIILCTGREEAYRKVTEEWLRRHDLAVYRALHMRKSQDYRADTIVKMEMLAAIRAEGYRPVMAFDDRNAVVAAWRSAGIPCAQVAEGDF
jgi:phosphoglycolate phosphatase-like HAD superfamily hydrolase